MNDRTGSGRDSKKATFSKSYKSGKLRRTMAVNVLNGHGKKKKKNPLHSVTTYRRCVRSIEKKIK